MHLATLDTTATEARALPASAVPIASPTLTDIAVVGLGYVGLPLSLQFARCGVNVLGLDVDPEKVNALNEGRSYIKHVSPESVADQVKANRLEAATDFSRVDEVDAVIICVPTPLNKNREPDIAYILQTGRAVAPHLRKGTLVVLESTTYPGTTDEDLRAVLETESGRKAGVDFHLAFSPEREDPANPDSNVSEVPKLVGGFTPACLQKAVQLYQRAIKTVVPVSSCLGLPPRPNEVDEGLAALSGFLAIDRTAKVIIISGQGDKENALRGVGAGAYDFLCKPIEIEELKFLLRRCFYVANLEKEYREMQRGSGAEPFEGIIGTSTQMQEVFAAIRKVATTSAPVLLLGESGTGKEMAAEAIHRRSLRNLDQAGTAMLSQVNCNRYKKRRPPFHFVTRFNCKQARGQQDENSQALTSGRTGVTLRAH